MRSPPSFINAAVDWQAANLALGIGVGPAAAARAQPASEAIGRYGFAHWITDLAESSVLPPFIKLLEQYPDASHIKVEQHFTWQKERSGNGDEVRVITGGFATLVIPGRGETTLPDGAWPLRVDREHWNLISTDDDKIHFTLARADVDAFTIGEVTSFTPLAEIVLQEHRCDCDPQHAAAHVRAFYGEVRVAQGKAPARWGSPGLHLMDAYLAQGGNPSAMDASGATPLAAALYLRAGDVVKKLVEAGADINAPVSGGLYPIDVAVLSGSDDMVRLCVDLGASVNTPGYLQPILRAVDMRSVAIFAVLADKGADMEVETPGGITLSQYVENTGDQYREGFLAVLTAKTIERAIDASAEAGAARPRSSKKGMSL